MPVDDVAGAVGVADTAALTAGGRILGLTLIEERGVDKGRGCKEWEEEKDKRIAVAAVAIIGGLRSRRGRGRSRSVDDDFDKVRGSSVRLLCPSIIAVPATCL